MSDTPGTSRRRFLAMVVAGAAAPGCGGSHGASAQAFGDVAAGTVSSLPGGALVAVSGVSACVGHDAGGLYAMTLTCTHQGCEASVVGDQVACPCHGSVFDSNGAVVNGPATEPLVHFAVSVDTTGNITVHGGTEVDASTRVAP